MLAAAVGAEVRGVIVDQFDVAHQGGAGVGAFDQVVAEQRVFREAPLQHGAQGIHFVDALAGEYALAEKILVDIGNGARINIETGLSGIQRCQAAARSGLHADADSRLQDAVPLHDHAAGRIDYGLVERMGDGAHKARGRIARELRVGIQGDDVAHIGQDGGSPTFTGKASNPPRRY